MIMARIPNLSKSRFQAGLQCHKRLWLECYRREVADPLDPARLALFNQGHRFGELAREYYGGGVLISEDFRHGDAAVATTARLLADGATCLYEAAFSHEGVLVRVDIVRRTGEDDAAGGWQLVEVKSSTRLKPEHITDAAIQTYVARGSGLPVNEIHLLHLDPNQAESYALDADGPHDLDELFITDDITAQVEEYLPSIPALLGEMKTMLGAECPAIGVGEHCSQPYDCFFWGYCHGAQH